MKTEEITGLSKILGKLLYEARRERKTHPEGRSDGKRWYASAHETRECCASIRAPSANFPWSQMVHCRSKKHCVSLYEQTKRSQLPADALEILRAFELEELRRAENPTSIEIAQ